jgi:hypothetical protein
MGVWPHSKTRNALLCARSWPRYQSLGYITVFVKLQYKVKKEEGGYGKGISRVRKSRVGRRDEIEREKENESVRRRMRA